MNDLFEIAIKMEKNGHAVYYNSSIGKLKNRKLKSLLQWMADEETVHGKWFLEQKNNLSLEAAEARLTEMVPEVLQNMMGEKTLLLDEIDFAQFTKISQLLETFIGFEEDTIQFYELLEIFIEDERVLTGLKAIIQEEKKHVEQLRAMVADLSEEDI